MKLLFHILENSITLQKMLAFSLKVYIRHALSKQTVLYSRGNFTGELGKAGWTGVYFITPSDIHTSGVRKPQFLVSHFQTLVSLKVFAQVET